MNSDGSLASEDPLTDHNCKRKILSCGMLCRIEILKKCRGGISRFIHKLQEGIKITVLEAFRFLFCSSRFIEEMRGSHNRSVGRLLSELGNTLVELCFIHLTQNLFSEEGCDCLHLFSNCHVIVRQILVAAFCICDAKRVSALTEIVIDLFDDRICNVGEINSDESTKGGYRLVEKSALLTEVGCLCKPSDPCHFECAALFLIIMLVDHRANEHFEGCRGGDTAAANDV